MVVHTILKFAIADLCCTTATAKPDEQAARGSSAAREAESAAIPPVPSLSVGNLVDYSEDKPEPQDSPRVSLVVDDLDDQLYGLVKSVSGAGGAKGEVRTSSLLWLELTS